MSGWRETKEDQEQDDSQEVTSEQLSSAGISAIRGETRDGGDQVSPRSDGADDLITVHPRKNPETLPSPEVEPITVKKTVGEPGEHEGRREGEEGKIQPPPGWQPGGPERGG